MYTYIQMFTRKGICVYVYMPMYMSMLKLISMPLSMGICMYMYVCMHVCVYEFV